LNIYSQQTEKEITLLNKTIIALRTKVGVLEEELKRERESREQIPLPKSIIKQILELEKKVKDLDEEVSFLQKYVPEEVLINRKSKNVNLPSRKGSGLR
jgi:hypothetical protein